VPEPTGIADVGLASGDWKREGIVVEDGFVVSLWLCLVSSRLTPLTMKDRHLRHFRSRLRHHWRIATVLRPPIFPLLLRG
jgi:hypothetical protein